MRLVLVMFIWLVHSVLFSYIYLHNCADLVGVSNLNTISHSPLTSYYQSAIANQGISCSISQPFQFSEIENGNISFSKKFKDTSFSLGSVYLLSEYYNQFSNYLNLNYTFHDLITLGIGQKLISVDEEENYSYTITDVGFKIAKDKTQLAINYTNIFSKKSSKLELPNIIDSEISYNPLENTFIAVGVEKEKSQKLSTRFGIRYKLLQSLSLLSGYCLEPNQISFGIGIDCRDITINYAIITHPELDSTHHISIIYGL